MNDKLVAYAQIILAILYTLGFFAVLIMFMLGYSKVPPEFANAFAGLLSLLSAAQLSIMAYFFQRQRAASTPDPATTASTTTTQTRTAPTGQVPTAPTGGTVPATMVPSTTGVRT